MMWYDCMILFWFIISYYDIWSAPFVPIKMSWSRGLWARNLEPNYLSLQCRCLSPGNTVWRMWGGCASYRCEGELHGVLLYFSPEFHSIAFQLQCMRWCSLRGKQFESDLCRGTWLSGLFVRFKLLNHAACILMVLLDVSWLCRI